MHHHRMSPIQHDDVLVRRTHCHTRPTDVPIRHCPECATGRQYIIEYINTIIVFDALSSSLNPISLPPIIYRAGYL